MSRVHSSSSSSDNPTTFSFDHHHHYVYRKPSYESVNRSRAGGGGRGRGHGEKCCFGCGLPGHIVRQCPFFSNSFRNYAPRRNQASINDPLESDPIESTSGTPKGRSKPLNTSPEISTSSDPAKPFCNELLSKNADIASLQARIKLKERELELHAQEIDTLKGQLSKVTSELESSQAKNEEMILNMDGLQKDLERCRNELSYESNKNKESTMKWFSLNKEFEETRDKLNEKINKLEKANLTAYAEKMKLKLETKQWRKVGKAVASVLVEHADIRSKVPELESVVLYYSTRAAKRMSHGKIRKAIDDCRMATQLDPGFLKVYLTAGNCHMLLGEIDDALNYFKKCVDSRTVCLDRRLIIEASQGLQNAKKVVNYLDQSAELLQSKTIESATNALEVLTEALSISCYSEKLLEMKGEALFMLHKYDEVAQMCEQTLVFAEKNCVTIADCNQMSDEVQKQPLKLWRWSLMSRSYFHMAKFDLALAILEKYEQRVPSETKAEGLSFPSATTMCELLRYKSAGNKAFEGGKYREAVEHYSNAIRQSIESRSFTAICLCNRAAAHQALGEIVDAIADCNLAIALDGDYTKAISRRANLYEKIKDYVHAALDFERLVSLLEKRSEKKYVEDLKVARWHLSFVKRKMKQGMTMDLYLILGLEESATGLEIKKAYRKAALRHHPDKAGKFLPRSVSGANDHVWKQIFTTIYNDADKLFKIIGEAYAVLSDSDKRFKYNLEDAMNDSF